jgi:transposase
LGELSPQLDQLYSKVGRPSIPPEHLLRALLLQVLYSVRSERLLMEQLDYNLLFRWFVGLAMDDPIWDATVFTKNRERLLRGDIARAFFERVRAQAEQRGLLSDEHFTVDGTLIDAWASLKSFQRKDAPPPRTPNDPRLRALRLLQGDPARGPEHREPAECDRSAHHAPPGLRGESTEAQADRRGLRLAQDHRPDAANAPPRPPARRVDVRLQLGGLQPGAHQELG